MAPYTRILAAVDFSEASAAALTYATRLSRAFGAELLVIHVIDPLLAAAAAEKGVAILTETQTALEAFCTGACSLSGVRCQVVTGLASDSIMHIADREGADLIVAGSRGIALPERVTFGLTTERLLRVSNTSVLVVPDSLPSPAAGTESGIGPIVVGLECTGGAADAARAGKEIAAALRVDIRFVHAVGEIQTSERWSALTTIALRRRGESARHELTTLLEGLSLDAARLDVRPGAVPRVLAEAIADKPGALVVLGRCYGAPGHAGSAAMARRLLTLASVPVLVHVNEV